MRNFIIEVKQDNQWVYYTNRSFESIYVARQYAQQLGYGDGREYRVRPN